MRKKIMRSSGISVPDSLLSTLSVPISERQRKCLNFIDSEDYLPVVLKVREELSKQNVILSESYEKEGILALKQYYAICFLDDNAHAINESLDPFWHAHILHTVQYQNFSQNIGVEYMHHAPRNWESKEEGAAIKIMYDHTQDSFAKCFNWISPIFNKKIVEDSELVCTHYTQNRFVQEGDLAIKPIPRIREAEMYFIRNKGIPQN